jgi:hypothetical protein
MNKKLLIGLIVVIVGLVIATVIFKPMWLLEVVLIGVFIFLVFMVWKRKTSLFHDQMEPKIAERRLKWLKTSLLVAGISLAAIITFMVGFVLYFSAHGVPETETENPVAFFIGFSLFLVFIIATIGSLVIFLTGRRKQRKRIPK